MSVETNRASICWPCSFLRSPIRLQQRVPGGPPEDGITSPASVPECLDHLVEIVVSDHEVHRHRLGGRPFDNAENDNR